jgi:hypothetical protein
MAGGDLERFMTYCCVVWLVLFVTFLLWFLALYIKRGGWWTNDAQNY